MADGSFNIDMVFRANSAAAVKAANEVKGAVTSVSDATGKSSEATGRNNAALETTATSARAVAAAAAGAADATSYLGSAGEVAGEAMGNLAGTISGPAMVGASGTVSSIGAAFLGMLNPISLAVSAASIAGAAMAHWLWSSATGAGSLKDALADLGTEVEAYRKAVDLVNAPTAKLQERFGDAAGRAREILALLAEIKRGSVNDTLTDMLDKISNQGEWDILDRQPFGIRQWRWSKERPLDDLKADFRGLAAADNLDSQIVAANKLLATYLQLADASGSRNEQEKAFIKLLGETILELEAQKESEKVSPLTRQQQLGYEYSARSRQQAAGAQTEATGLLASLQQENSLRAASLQYGEGSLQVANLRADAERKAFEEMLAGLDVAESTKEELRAAFEEGQRLATADIAGGIRSAAAEALNLANRLNAAVGAAMSLASQGGNALREAQLKNEFKGDPVQLAKELAAARFDASVNLPADADPEIRNVVEGERRKTVSNAGEAAELDRQTAAWQAAQTAAARGSSGRGARQENDSVGDLISSLQAEGDILRETDPVQKEMLRYREKLAGATEKQRQEVEAKIASNIAERIQVEALQETWDFVGQSALSALDDMIVKGKSASDVVANLASALASAALQSALLGTGPLASLFGTAGTGGLLGAIFPGSIPAKADGGSISGPGTGTSDSVLMWASNGEFMVNAASTARYRPLLERINADKTGAGLPRFATGGAISRAVSPASWAGTTAPAAQKAGVSDQRVKVEVRLSDDLNARIDERSRGVSAEVVKGGLEQYDRQVLPARFQQIRSDPRKR